MRKTLKIVVTGTRGIPNIQGGIETHCEELFPRIAKYGLDIILVRRSDYVTSSITYPGIKYKDIKVPKITGLESAIHTFLGVLYAKKIKADIIHIHAIGPSIVVPFAKMLGLKVVVTHHGPDYDREKWGKFSKFILKTGERFAARYADDIIVISTVISDILKNKYKRTKNVHLIYNGVNVPEKVRSNSYLSSLGIIPQKYILAVGRFVEEKNFDKLIDVCVKLKDFSPCQLVIAGDADIETTYSRELKEKAKLNDVILTGMVKNEKLAELFSHAALFVLPSSHEGLSLSLLEAMSYKRKVVVSDIPANLAVNLDKESYFNLNAPDDLQNRILYQLNLTSSDKEYNLSMYDWDNIAIKTICVYKEEVC